MPPIIELKNLTKEEAIAELLVARRPKSDLIFPRIEDILRVTDPRGRTLWIVLVAEIGTVHVGTEELLSYPKFRRACEFQQLHTFERGGTRMTPERWLGIVTKA